MTAVTPVSTPTVCAAVVSRNEADLLPKCLSRLGWVDELLVLDMESDDSTGDVAGQYGARIINVPFVPIVERTRNVALVATECDWLLFVDPDEIIPGSWAVEIRPFLSDQGVAAYRIPFREVAFGVPLRHSFRGARKLALMRPDSAAYEPDSPAHREPTITGRVSDLMAIEAVEHHSRRDIAGAVEKSFRYGISGGVATHGASSLDAFLLPRLLFRSIIRGGAWRDGRAGIAAVSLAAIGEYVGALRQWELAGYPDPELPSRTRLTLRMLSFLRGLGTAVRRPISFLRRVASR